MPTIQSISPRIQPGASTPVGGSVAPRDPNFDKYVRQFAPQVFLEPTTGKLVIELQRFAEVGSPPKRLELKDRHFVGDLATGRVVSFQPSGTFGQGAYYQKTFDGFMLERTGDEIRAFNSNGTSTMLSRVTGPAAERALARIAFDKGEQRAPVFFAKLAGRNAFAYIDKAPFHEGDYRFVMGTPGDLKSHRVLEIRLSPDDASTTIKTDVGVFRIPSALDAGVAPTFEDSRTQARVPLQPFSLGTRPSAETAAAFKLLGIQPQGNLTTPHF